MGPRLTGINRYPIKSCRGHAVPFAVVWPWGLDGDRRWMLVNEAGRAVTAREYPQLVLVNPRLTADGLLVEAPGADPLWVRTPAEGAHLRVWLRGSEVLATAAAEQAHAWFSAVVGTPVRLVYLDDPTRRRPDPRYSSDLDRVSFADGFPLLLASEDSLAALNALIANGPNTAEGPVPMARFRPNLVVAGAPAWAEDRWRMLQIGVASFRVAKGCSRCVLTTIDPETATRGKEPLSTLARHRRWDGRAWFAVNLIPCGSGATIRLGDEVKIVKQVETSGPPR